MDKITATAICIAQSFVNEQNLQDEYHVAELEYALAVTSRLQYLVKRTVQGVESNPVLFCAFDDMPDILPEGTAQLIAVGEAINNPDYTHYNKSRYFTQPLCYYGADDILVQKNKALLSRNAALRTVGRALNQERVVLGFNLLIELAEPVAIDDPSAYIKALRQARFALMPPEITAFYSKNTGALTAFCSTPQTFIKTLAKNPEWEEHRLSLSQSDEEFALLPKELQDQQLSLIYEAEAEGHNYYYLNRLATYYGVAIDKDYLASLKEEFDNLKKEKVA